MELARTSYISYIHKYGMLQ